MIPKKLHIKNFLSYGPETQIIDFATYNLICLSGKNGHGKSAMLDAITWALWGQARKTSGTTKADEGLVHLGQKHMLVIFDFEINGIAYRVRREFVKTQSHPFSALDFGIVKADDTFTTMTDKTIKATQTKLEKTIGITYDSFINSAFLRQGQANEFSKKSPKERKEILATILQLERFEDLKKIALEKSKNLQQHLLQRQSIFDRIGQEITELQTALLEKNHHAQQLALIEEQEKQALQLVVDDEQAKEALLEQHKKYEFLQLQKAQEFKQFAQLEQQMFTLQKAYQDIASQQTSGHDLVKLQEDQQKLRTVVATHQEKLNKRLELKDLYLTLQEKKQALEKELDQEKSTRVQAYEIQIKIAQEQIEQEQRELSKHRKLLENFHAQIAKIAQEISNLTQQNCPLCEQHLSASHQMIVQQKIEKQIKEEELSIAACTKKIADATKNLEQITIDQKKALAGSINPEKETIYLTLIKKIDALKQTGQALAYDKDGHEKDYKELQLIEGLLVKLQSLQKELAQQEQRSKQIADLQEQIKNVQKSCATFDQEIELIKDCPDNLAQHLKNQHEHKLQAQAITVQKSDLLNKKTILDLQQKKMTKLQDERILIEKELSTLNLEIVDFAEIVKALGKDGLQALLIEQALPEIEQEANILLAQLTDNQTQIYIESLRDLKKGGSKETLDIKISDAIGLRPYEMFSGGEAFRIDFALRIAISKLLARRAGTALQTLIIDEGFGSQDDDGLQLIMDSILKIQDNFAKVIIVSHLPAMKEQFPVQFLVEKKASGSVVTVIQQG
jgi:DNA repair protein SbcC/Rad50